MWKSRTRAPDDAELTAVPALQRAASAPAPAALEATYAPVARARIALAALALPRLSRYRDTGAAAVEFGFDRQLGAGPLGSDTLIGFAVDAADEVHVLGADGRQRIAVPSRFAPLDGVDIQVLAPAPAMADRYSALVRLPQAPALAVEHGAPLTFGRGTTALAPAARARRRHLPARGRRTPCRRRRSAWPVAHGLPLRGRAGRLPRHPPGGHAGALPPRRTARFRRRHRHGGGRGGLPRCRSATTSSPATTCCAWKREHGSAAARPGLWRSKPGRDPGPGRACDAARAWWRRPNARALLVLVGGTAAIGSALWWLAPHRSDPPAAPATAGSKRPGRDAATASPRR
ncbi:hypothetical protein [Massilia sp. Dwa41.01b]|uniref:hypothetical protein n=1 Tax=Massilia sp. Dwa41.01b TaxID=2709302 RepID=UPI001E395AC4|nr:hypothetical protein [Massilia sp. Dwa41.01b]